MTACKIFISYSHADEWLKNELVVHFAALKRNGLVDVWHDRRIPAGGILHDEIDANLHTSDLFLFLVSADFISSDYCMEKEYVEAVKRRDAGEAEIVPIIVRACDWDVGGLRRFSALPKDAVPVTDGADAKAEKQTRDSVWLGVIDGLKTVIGNIKKKVDPPRVRKDFQDELFKVDFIRHPSLAHFDERRILVDPDVYCETEKEQVSSFARLTEMCAAEKAVLITGSDRSGKTVVAKQLHTLFSSDTEHPAILINGKKIRNKDIEKLIVTSRNEQFEPSPFPIGHFRIIIDDFDECTLPDTVRENIVATLCETYKSCILISFSNAPSVLFTSKALPAPRMFLINPITDAKLYTLVQKWVSIAATDEDCIRDERVLAVFEKIQLVFEQTGLDKSPHTAATFLQFIETLSASDINLSSYAACYDMLIANRLTQAKINVQSYDEVRNFLSLVAYRAYTETESACLRRETFEDCLSIFEEQFLSSKAALRQASVGLFLKEEDEKLRFPEEYLWFFLCARYVVQTLQVHDGARYTQFVQHCTANIFQRKFANIVIYIAYFAADKFVLESLLNTLDGLFSKAKAWVISDESRELMIGIISRDNLEIESNADVAHNRLQLLQEKIADIINDADSVVARYTLPFLHVGIGDSTTKDAVDVSFDENSYIKSVNALLRTHSVIGQILAARSGTFPAQVLLDCIRRMVEASGRYVALNHAIAAVLMYDREDSVQEVGKVIRDDRLTPEEKYEKVTRIFGFWSVYVSHAGLARYLNQDHSIRALERLTGKYERDQAHSSGGNVPFNFTFVNVVARLYKFGHIDRNEIDDILRTYGEDSALMSLLRVVFHMYAYYMSFPIEDKQWLSQKLRMPIRRIEVQQLKAITAKHSSGSDARLAS